MVAELEAENKRLRKKLRDPEIEREILKKLSGNMHSGSSADGKSLRRFTPTMQKKKPCRLIALAFFGNVFDAPAIRLSLDWLRSSGASFRFTGPWKRTEQQPSHA